METRQSRNCLRFIPSHTVRYFGKFVLVHDGHVLLYKHFGHVLERDMHSEHFDSQLSTHHRRLHGHFHVQG
jgi:hypothetical protein